MRIIHAFLAASAMVAIASPAAAQIVNNGSFETGDFTGWSVSAGFSGVSSNFDGFTAQDGTYFAHLGNIGCCGTLSQTVSTTAGTDYLLSYYLASDGGTPNYFSASWNGTEIGGSVVSNGGAQGYTLYQFVVTGTGSDTLTFKEQNDPSYLALDNVSLNLTGAVPEPSTWAMMLLGFGGMGLALRRRRAVAAVA